MPQSLSHIVLHLIFSTKDRFPFIGADVRADLHAFLAGALREAGCDGLRVGGTDDHVHLAVGFSRTLSVAQLVADLKKSSSRWMKTQSAQLRKFAWQRGYSAFSVSPGDANALVEYIDGQEKHHRTRTFQDEYRAFLKKYNVEYNEAYVWD